MEEETNVITTGFNVDPTYLETCSLDRQNERKLQLSTSPHFVETLESRMANAITVVIIAAAQSVAKVFVIGSVGYCAVLSKG